jgi:methylglyoxal/glyoxal reductase
VIYMFKITDIKGTVELSNKVAMPYLGLGVFRIEDGVAILNAVQWAIEAGYRHIDTAVMYGNEKGVGTALRECGLPRNEIFVTSKVWNSDQGYDSTLKAFDVSMEKLGFEYLDLYLIHWPVEGKCESTWKALERLYKERRVRAIGVSNFQINDLENLAKVSEITPMVNQVEFNPQMQQMDLVNYCKEHKIQFESWRPLMKGGVFEIAELQQLAKKYKKDVAQIVLRWNLQKGVIVIPKSAHKERIISNSQIFDFQLSEEDMESINSLVKS